MTILNGYRLLGDLKPNNSGYAKWGFAEKNGRQYFIKEFLAPVYPVDTTVLSPEQLEKKRDICRDFEYKKRVFYNELNKCSTGNVVTISDFFRFGSKYYLVTEKVDAATIPIENIRALREDQKELILKIIVHCVMAVHQHGIVHSDLKPDNILFKRTRTGNFTAKIIDFDSSFLEKNYPKCDEEFQGDLVYLAPESFLLIAEEDVKLTNKIDIFALGVLFHQYYCGCLPGFDTTKYTYTFEAVLDDYPIILNPAIPPNIKELIGKMLLKNPEDRPDIEEVFSFLTGKKINTVAPEDSVSATGGAMVGGYAGGGYTTGATAPVRPRPTGGFFRVPDDL